MFQNHLQLSKVLRNKATLDGQPPGRQQHNPSLQSVQLTGRLYIYNPSAVSRQDIKFTYSVLVNGAMSMTLPSRLKSEWSYARSGWNGLVPLHYKGAAQLKTSKGIFYPPVKPLCIEWEVIIITRCMLSQLLFTYHYLSPPWLCWKCMYLLLEKWLRSISCTATTLYLLFAFSFLLWQKSAKNQDKFDLKW